MMHTLPEAFTLATIFGAWAPPYWKSSLARGLYDFYTFFNVLVMFLLLTAQLIALIVYTENMNEFAEASYVFFASFNGCVKGANLLWTRRKVDELTRVLLRDDCKAQNLEEGRILASYDRLSRYTTLSYATLVGMSSGATAILPAFLAPKDSYALQLKAWYPYEINNDLVYWITYVHQALGILIGAAWNTTNDTVIAGLMMQTCAQLDLMSFRLQVLPEQAKLKAITDAPSSKVRYIEQRVVKQSVIHHLQIFKFADDLKTIFAPSILVQFCLSIIILCITIYEMTAEDSNIPMSFMLIFLSSMLVELFLYCWFGNEVTLKSLGFSEVICTADWTELNVSTLKGILIMMLRTTSPILLTCGPFITLSLNSYTGILKLSYSVFNLLQSYH